MVFGLLGVFRIFVVTDGCELIVVLINAYSSVIYL